MRITTSYPTTLDAESNSRDCLDAAAGWDLLAKSMDEQVAYATERGHFPDVYKRNAAMYRNTAEALRREAATGVPFCACHLLTMQACAERAQRERAAAQPARRSA